METSEKVLNLMGRLLILCCLVTLSFDTVSMVSLMEGKGIETLVTGIERVELTSPSNPTNSSYSPSVEDPLLAHEPLQENCLKKYGSTLLISIFTLAVIALVIKACSTSSGSTHIMPTNANGI